MKKILLSATITGLMLISTGSFAVSSNHGYYVGCGSNWGTTWIIRAADMQAVSVLFETCENQGGTPYLIDGRK